jgi:hypothetical protein
MYIGGQRVEWSSRCCSCNRDISIWIHPRSEGRALGLKGRAFVTSNNGSNGTYMWLLFGFGLTE